MIRVVLPFHLRSLARVEGEVKLEVDGPITQRSVLTATRGPLSDVPRCHSRPRHPATPTLLAVLRVRAGSLFTRRPMRRCPMQSHLEKNPC